LSSRQPRSYVHHLFIARPSEPSVGARILRILPQKVQDSVQLQLDSRNVNCRPHTMKETKKTPVPLPGSKPKSKSKEKSTPKPDLSRELVSDDSSAEDTPQPKAAAKPKATIGVHRPNGAEKSTTKTKAKADATSKSATKTKPTPKKPEPKKIATQQQAEELSSSEQSDDSDAPARDIQTKLPGNDEKMQDASSSSSSESDSESDDSSSDDEAEAAAKKPAQE
jgi:hypothetical protein